MPQQRLHIRSGFEVAALAVIANTGIASESTGDGRLVVLLDLDPSTGGPIASEAAAAKSLYPLLDLGVGAPEPAPFRHEASITAADGSTSTFAFSAPIRTLLAAFCGGIPQLPADVSVDQSGNLVLGGNVSKPSDPVTAFFLA